MGEVSATTSIRCQDVHEWRGPLPSLLAYTGGEPHDLSGKHAPAPACYTPASGGLVLHLSAPCDTLRGQSVRADGGQCPATPTTQRYHREGAEQCPYTANSCSQTSHTFLSPTVPGVLPYRQMAVCAGGLSLSLSATLPEGVLQHHLRLRMDGAR